MNCAGICSQREALTRSSVQWTEAGRAEAGDAARPRPTSRALASGTDFAFSATPHRRTAWASLLRPLAFAASNRAEAKANEGPIFTISAFSQSGPSSIHFHELVILEAQHQPFRTTVFHCARVRQQRKEPPRIVFVRCELVGARRRGAPILSARDKANGIRRGTRRPVRLAARHYSTRPHAEMNSLLQIATARMAFRPCAVF